MNHKILFLDETAEIGGAEINLVNLAGSLKKRGWNPVAILPSEGPLFQRLARLNIPIYLVPGAPAKSVSIYLWGQYKVPNPLAWAADFYQGVKWILKLQDQFRKIKPDVVQTVSMMGHLFGSPAARLAGIPVVSHFQDIVSAGSGFGAYRFFLFIWARYVPDRIVSISPLVARQFSNMPLDEKKMQTIWNAVDLSHFRPLGVSMQIGCRPLRIASIARIARWKGQHIALKCAHLLKGGQIPFEWKFVGNTGLGSEEYFNELKDAIGNWDLEDRVHFQGWVDDMPAFYNSIDVLVHTPIEPEPFGLVLAEALASGVPIIASEGGGMDELVAMGGGVLVPAGLSEPVFDAIAYLWNHPDEYARRAQTARQLASQVFNVEKNLDQWAGLYHSLA